MRAFLMICLLLLLSGCSQASSLPYTALQPQAAYAYQDPALTPTVAAVGRSGETRPSVTPPPGELPPTPIPPPTDTPVPPTATPGAPPLLEGAPAPVLAGELTMRTYSVDFYRLPGGMTAETIQALALPAEQAIISGSMKLGTGLTGRIAIRFEPPQTGPCAIRGLTLSSERTIRMFYEPEVDPNRVLAILAHEFIHQLQHDFYGETVHRRSDVILLEGMAVWGSSPYFLTADGQPLYHVRARQALLDGNLLPLTTDLVADCRTTTRGNIYDQWGSFVEYLLLAYGRENLDALYRDSTGRPAGSANYQGVYGKSLSQLEAEWVEWLGSTPQ